MSIINNANAGSEINLLCLIYRVISRNNNKLSVNDIQTLCRPDNLPEKKDQEKKFRETLNFWMRAPQQLWVENEDSKLEIYNTGQDSFEPTLDEIASVVNEILFKLDVEDMFEKNHASRHFYELISCVLSVDSFSVSGDLDLKKNATLDTFFGSQLPGSIPNSNEKGLWRNYGYFLGFLEISPSGRVYADPTRAIKWVLPKLFADHGSLRMSDFISRLGKFIKVLDGGKFRSRVESQMNQKVNQSVDDFHLSKTLSISLERLRLENLIRLNQKDDDQDAFYLHLESTPVPCSEVIYVGSNA